MWKVPIEAQKIDQLITNGKSDIFINDLKTSALSFADRTYHLARTMHFAKTFTRILKQ